MIIRGGVPGPLSPRVPAILCASASGLALLVHAAGGTRLPFLMVFLVLPCSLAIVWAYARSSDVSLDWFRERLLAGVWIGLAATLAYDLTRFVIGYLFSFAFDPFRLIPAAGALICGVSAPAPISLFAGWVYHFWNGASFAVMYVLAAGSVRWPFAVLWAMLLEAMMMASYPSLFQLPRWDVGFIALSLVGHIAYGVVLGVLAERRRFAPVPGRYEPASLSITV